jgi:hypothetical protein
MEPGSIEGIGEAVSGGLLARAVEPAAGEGITGAGLCLNCGTELIGRHCHNCGQAGHVHRTLTAWWHDFAHGVLHLDGKIWRTLPLLAWRPGELTRRYIEGERARFVSPLALFLFSVFLMFAVFSAFGGPIFGGNHKAGLEAAQALQAERKAAEAKVARLEAERARAVREKKSVSAIDARIASAREDLRGITLASKGGMVVSGNSAVEMEGVDLGWFDDAYRRAKQNPTLLVYKLETNAYKFSWALIPISVPFVWLLFFWKRRYKIYDHTVFVTYSLAFMTLMTIVVALAKAAGLSGGVAVMAITLIPPIHMYRQLRGAYQLRRLSALWRTFFLLFFALIAAMLFLLLLITLGVLG